MVAASIGIVIGLIIIPPVLVAETAIRWITGRSVTEWENDSALIGFLLSLFPFAAIPVFWLTVFFILTDSLLANSKAVSRGPLVQQGRRCNGLHFCRESLLPVRPAPS